VKIARAFVLLALVGALALSLSPVAMASPKPALKPAVVCDHGVVLSAIQLYDQDGDFFIVVYVQKLVDTHGTYCGYTQPFTRIRTTRAYPFSDEPMVAAYTQLYQQSGLYLDGYTWTGLGYAKNDQSDWWFYGPRVWVTCGSPVHAWGSWLEQASSTGEWYLVQSNTQPAEGESVGTFSSVVTAC